MIVLWDNQKIGEVTRCGGVYTFQYDADAPSKMPSPLPEFPNWKRTYKALSLFPTFASRVPSNVDGVENPEDPLEVLAAIEVITDKLTVMHSVKWAIKEHIEGGCVGYDAGSFLADYNESECRVPLCTDPGAIATAPKPDGAAEGGGESVREVDRIEEILNRFDKAFRKMAHHDAPLPCELEHARERLVGLLAERVIDEASTIYGIQAQKEYRLPHLLARYPLLEAAFLYEKSFTERVLFVVYEDYLDAESEEAWDLSVTLCDWVYGTDIEVKPLVHQGKKKPEEMLPWEPIYVRKSA